MSNALARKVEPPFLEGGTTVSQPAAARPIRSRQRRAEATVTGRPGTRGATRHAWLEWLSAPKTSRKVEFRYAQHMGECAQCGAPDANESAVDGEHWCPDCHDEQLNPEQAYDEIAAPADPAQHARRFATMLVFGVLTVGVGGACLAVGALSEPADQLMLLFGGFVVVIGMVAAPLARWKLRGSA